MVSKSGCWLLALSVGVALLAYNALGQAQEVCRGDNALALHCAAYVKKEGPKVPPSGDCCAAVQDADIPCVCRHVTKEVEKIISMEKVVYVARYCKKPFDHGSKCGSYTVPAVL